MAHVNLGSEDVLDTPEDIEAYLLGKIAQNGKKNIGTEVEFFFLDSQQRPITVENSQRAFTVFRDVFDAQDYETSFQTETHDGHEYITSLAVNGIGNVDLETGHGFEFASTICRDPNHTLDVNRVMFDALRRVEDCIDYYAVFRGYVPEYAHPIPVKRERSLALRTSYRERFGAAAEEILKVQSATASTQINIDCCQDAFHEVFRVLLIAEPALTLHYADNTNRALHRRNAYSALVPQQVDPITDAWTSNDNAGVIRHIVERLLTINVPFLPDSDGLLRKLPRDSITGQPPTVRNLMEQGKLTEKALKNILPLFQTHPALRRPGVLELRGPDSQNSPEKIAELASTVAHLCYDESTRHKTLQNFQHLAVKDIKTLHEVTAWADRDAAMQQIVGGMSVENFVQEIVEAGQTAFHRPPPSLEGQYLLAEAAVA